jgi:hypothetical protein
LVRNASPLGELRVGQSASFLSQEFCQLLIQVASHTRKLAKIASRMRDDCALQDNLLL